MLEPCCNFDFLCLFVCAWTSGPLNEHHNTSSQPILPADLILNTDAERDNTEVAPHREAKQSEVSDDMDRVATAFLDHLKRYQDGKGSPSNILTVEEAQWLFEGAARIAIPANADEKANELEDFLQRIDIHDPSYRREMIGLLRLFIDFLVDENVRTRVEKKYKIKPCRLQGTTPVSRARSRWTDRFLEEHVIQNGDAIGMLLALDYNVIRPRFRVFSVRPALS